MQEGDPFAFGADARRLIDESETGRSALIQCAVEVVHGEAHMMDPGAAPGHELPDRRVLGFCFEEFDQRFSGCEPRDLGAVGVIEWDLGQPQNITVERKQLVKGTYSDADMGYARTAADRFSHMIWRGLKLNSNPDDTCG